MHGVAHRDQNAGWPVSPWNHVRLEMATAHHVDQVACPPKATRRWAELAWIVKVWGTAALLVLMLELAGVHPNGLLMRIWSQLLGLQ